MLNISFLLYRCEGQTKCAAPADNTLGDSFDGTENSVEINSQCVYDKLIQEQNRTEQGQRKYNTNFFGPG